MNLGVLRSESGSVFEIDARDIQCDCDPDTDTESETKSENDQPSTIDHQPVQGKRAG
jgi:hypothetical protein